jgi:hypothetical protein
MDEWLIFSLNVIKKSYPRFIQKEKCSLVQETFSAFFKSYPRFTQNDKTTELCDNTGGPRRILRHFHDNTYFILMVTATDQPRS